MGLARDILDGLERRLHAHAGFDLPEWIVEARALSRMSALDLGAQAYLDLVSSPRGAAELSALVEAVRVGETRFFRHRPQVDALLEVVVPAWRERGERSPRVWSAGCATGEEAYTLALVLGRALPGPTSRPSILATDVSAEALAVARRATYPVQAWDGVPEPWQGGLVREGDAVRVRAEVAALVTFEQQNLADAELPRGFDLVWCRNVLIYFGPEARRRVLEKLVLALKPGGFLFLGYSETLRQVGGLREVHHGGQVLWQKGAVRSGHEGTARTATATAAATGAATRTALKGRIQRGGAEGAEGERRLSPLGVQFRAVMGGGSVDPSRGSRLSGAAPTEPRALASGPEPRASASGHAPSRPKHPPSRPPPARATLEIRTTDASSLAADLRAALGAPGLATLTVDLDTAEYLDDEVAPVLKRAAAAAESAGIELVLRATRPGTSRWLRRNGLAGGEK